MTSTNSRRLLIVWAVLAAMTLVYVWMDHTVDESGTLRASTVVTVAAIERIVPLRPEERIVAVAAVNDVGAVAAAVGDLLADPDRGAAMGAAGRRWAVEHWQWRRQADRLARLL